MPDGNGSEMIKFSKEEFDSKVNYLSFVSNGLFEYMVGASPVEKGGNVSAKVDAFVEVYNDLFELVKLYNAALATTVDNLRTAGEALVDTDAGASESMS